MEMAVGQAARGISDVLRREMKSSTGTPSELQSVTWTETQMLSASKPGEHMIEDKYAATERLLAPTEAPRRHVRALLTLGKLKVPGVERWEKAMVALNEYVDAGSIAALLGPRGVGKTQMATCAIHYVRFGGRSAQYTTAMGFFSKLKDCFASDERTQVVLGRFEMPYLLVLDEIEVRSGSQWETDMLTHLVDRRYGALKPTIIISNMTADAFRTTMPESIVSRITEGGGIVTCGWESFRPHVGKM